MRAERTALRPLIVHLNVDLTVRSSRHAVSGYASPRVSRRDHQETTPPQVDP